MPDADECSSSTGSVELEEIVWQSNAAIFEVARCFEEDFSSGFVLRSVGDCSTTAGTQRKCGMTMGYTKTLMLYRW